jgi:hypothetical protein
MKDGIYEIEIKEVEEHKDGSATLQIEMSNDTRNLLIQAGLISLIHKYLDKNDMVLEDDSKTD